MHKLVIAIVLLTGCGAQTAALCEDHCSGMLRACPDALPGSPGTKWQLCVDGCEAAADRSDNAGCTEERVGYMNCQTANRCGIECHDELSAVNSCESPWPNS